MHVIMHGKIQSKSVIIFLTSGCPMKQLFTDFGAVKPANFVSRNENEAKPSLSRMFSFF